MSTTTITEIANRARSISFRTQKHNVPTEERYKAINAALLRVKENKHNKAEARADSAIILSNLSALIGS